MVRCGKGCAAAVCILACILALAGNSIARRTAEQIGSSVLATRVQIGRVDIRWSAIVIENLSLSEPATADQKQVSIDRIVLVPASWQAIRRGIWLRQITLQRPVLQVQFDRHGELLSIFPTMSGDAAPTGDFAIPVEHLVIQDAGLIVSQTDREDLRIEGVAVTAHFAEKITAHAQIPSLLAGKAEFSCALDAKTLAGSSRLNMVGMALDTKQLVQLPLAPPGIADEPITASMSISFRGNHPENNRDLRGHSFKCRIAARDIASGRFQSLAQRFDVSLEHADGRTDLNAVANPLDGEFRLHASADLSQTDFLNPEFTTAVTISLQDCQLHVIGKHFAELADLFASISGDARGELRWQDGSLAFTGNMESRVQEVRLDSLALPPITGRLYASGALTPGVAVPLAGSLSAELDPLSLQLNQFAKHFNLPPIAGSLLAQGQFTMPLDRWQDPAGYVGSASLQTRGITGLDMRVNDTTISASLRDANAVIDAPELVVYDQHGSPLASLQGGVAASLSEHGRLRANTAISLQPSPAIISALGLEQAQPRGQLRCSAEANCPVGSLANVRAWTVSANVLTKGVSIAGEAIEDIDLHASLEESVLSASPLLLRWRGNTCQLQSGGKLDEALTLHAKLDASQVNLQDVSEVLSKFSTTELLASGLADIQGEFEYERSLQSKEQNFIASGSATLQDAMVSRTRIGTAALTWNADRNGLNVSTGSNDFFGGRFDATARMAELDWTRTQIEGDFSDISLPRLVALTNQRLPSTGVLEGGFRVTSIASLEELSGAAWMRSRQMTLSRVPVELARSHVSVNAGQIHVSSDGRVAEGRFSATAEAPLQAFLEFAGESPLRVAEVPLTAQLHLHGVPIPSLASAFKMPPEMRGLGGTLSATLSRDKAAWDGRHLVTATAGMEDLRFNHARLSDRIVANLTLHPTQVELTSVQGRFADGDLSGKAVVQLEQTPTGRFDFLVRRVNLRRASAALGIADVSGSGSGRVRGHIGPVISGRAEVSVDNAVAAGVAIRQSRLPVEWSFMPSSKTMRWQCRAGSVALGGGNLRIATEGSYANALSMSTSVRVERLDLAKLMHSGSLASGIVDGEVMLRAKHARTAKHIVGTYDFEMKNIKALEIPVLDQLPKLVSLSPQVPGRGLNGGTVHGRIGGGLVHVDEIALYQSNVQVLVSGTATLQGRLDLDVIASTESTSPTDQLVSMLDSPLMLAAPAPVALIAKANELLKDRTVRVHVGGTADNPTLRLQPGKQLSQNAVKFFLTNSIGATATQFSQSQSRNTRR